MRIHALTLVFLIAAAGAAWAQGPRTGHWNQDHDPHVAAIGLSMGYTSGTGLAVRWPAFRHTMLTASGAIWGDDEDLDWNIGLEAHYILRQAGRVRFFAGPAIAQYSDARDSHTNLSAGVGLEVLVRERVAVKFDLGFTYLGDEDKVYPLPQVGAYFYW